MHKVIEIAGAEWCTPCGNAKERISAVAYQMGININFHDLGEREHFHRGLGDLKDRGFVIGDMIGIPMFFKDRKQIEGPKSYDLNNIKDWINDNYVNNK